MLTKNFIPWQSAEEWQETRQFIHTIDKVNKNDFGQIYTFAASARKLFEEISSPMDDICSAVCVKCRDICCEKATIWYDFKDLLYLYFAFNTLPESQITKNIKKDGSTSHCTHLTETGCALSRLKRPFVCTWYICSAQKQFISSGAQKDHSQIQSKIEKIKLLRNSMESGFCQISSGSKIGSVY